MWRRGLDRFARRRNVSMASDSRGRHLKVKLNGSELAFEIVELRS
jgi:hypothetical protein